MAFAALLAAAPAAAVDIDDLRAALSVCRSIEALPPDERVPTLEAVSEVADRAVEIAPADPLAHFTAFCAIGKRRQLLGLGFGALGDVRRARRALEHALALAPDWSDALAAKGAFLMELPSWLGGDVDEAERLLERAVVLDPENAEARRLLQGLRAARGAVAATISEP